MQMESIKSGIELFSLTFSPNRCNLKLKILYCSEMKKSQNLLQYKVLFKVFRLFCFDVGS
jgi:hypothetical protein